jgi:ribosomal protein S18 acetylase RimI-like enzyme
VILRAATADDEAAITGLAVGDVSDPWIAEVAEIVEGLWAWRLEPSARPLDRQLIVAVTVDGTVQGVVAHEAFMDDEGRVHRSHRYLMVIAIDLDARRQGTAALLATSVIADMKSHGVRGVEWLVHPRNSASSGFSRSVFREADEQYALEDSPYARFALHLN